MTLQEQSWRETGNRPAGGRPNRLAQALLTPASWLYGAGLFCHREAYALGLARAASLPVPVFAVGNLTLGGAGKTPTVCWLARLLRDWGRSPAIVSRGYHGSAERSGCLVSDADGLRAPVEQSGDEPQMLARALPGVPVLAGSRRAPLARQAVAELGADTLILDDAFQHWKIRRDFNLLVIDAVDPFGNRRLLPAGSLREPLTAIARADAALLTQADVAGPAATGRLEEELRRHAPNLPIAQVRCAPIGLRDLVTGEQQTLDALRDRSVFALSGIARPERFIRSLEETGALVVDALHLEDHHAYSEPEVRALAHRAAAKSAALVTTDKDAVKIPPQWLTGETGSQETPVYALEIEWEWLEGLDVLEDVIRECLESTTAAAA